MIFKHTRAAINDTLSEIKAFVKVFGIVSSLIYIGYLAYALIVKTGNFYVNATLLAISTVYFIFSLFTSGKKGKKMKMAKRITRRFAVWSKLLIKAYTLGVAVYGIVLSSGKSSTLSIILTVLMIVFWVIQLLAEIIVFYAERKVDVFVAAFSMDKEVVDKPMRAVGNFVKKITGREETEYEYVDGKMRDKIEKMADKYEEQVREEKKEKHHSSWSEKKIKKPDQNE
jgi:hypothetical protein